MNDLLANLGLLDWKPVLGVLLLPPVPLLALLLLGGWWRARRPVAAGALTVLAIVGLWLSNCQAVGRFLERQLAVAPTLGASRLAELRHELAKGKAAVLVLGGGAHRLAPEYGEAHLSDRSLQRLHYGIWLGRQLQLPVMASGGVGRTRTDGPSEAEIAARIASRDYGRPLRWLETGSRDTRGNARLSLPLVQAEGIQTVLLVTDGWHMRRALRNFDEAAQASGYRGRIVPAPMGLAASDDAPLLQWLPSSDGYRRVRQALHEALGLLMGA